MQDVYERLRTHLDRLPAGFPATQDGIELQLVSAFRSEIPSDALKVGASLTDEDGFLYRVTRLHRSPNSLIARVECAVLNP